MAEQPNFAIIQLTVKIDKGHAEVHSLFFTLLLELPSCKVACLLFLFPSRIHTDSLVEFQLDQGVHSDDSIDNKEMPL